MFDILIIGGGPAGISAGIYAKRAGKSVAIIEKSVPGGQVAVTGEVENYPGVGRLSGAELATKFYDHAISLGVEFIFDEALEAFLKGKIKRVKCRNATYQAKAVIIAMGCYSRELNVSGEKKFFGRGVSYCATCDGNFFKGKDVAVVGSGDSAVSNALYLSEICKSVSLFAKNNLKLRAYKEENLTAVKNIEVFKNVKVTEIVGDEKIEGIKYIADKKEHLKKVEGIFVSIGRNPDTELLAGKIKLDEKGYVVPKKQVYTNISGVFACGDVANPTLKQIVTATNTGAIAATEAIKYLAKHK